MPITEPGAGQGRAQRSIHRWGRWLRQGGVGGRSLEPANHRDSVAEKYYSPSRRQIGYLRFILESYDGLAFVRTLDSRQALVEIAYPASRRGDAEALLVSLAAECAMTAVAAPDAADLLPLAALLLSHHWFCVSLWRGQRPVSDF
ncbi:MAG: DUF4911 domain-containing protein [Syntrophotaleaceae bacterium]